MLKSARHAGIGELAAHRSAIDALADAARESALPTIIADGLAEGHPVHFANDAFRAIAGRVCEKALGQPLLRLIGERTDPSAVSLLQAALDDGRSGFWHMRLAFDQGDPFPAVVYLTCVREPQGQVVAHCINIVDLASLGCVSREHGSISPLICDQAPGFIAISRGKITPSNTPTPPIEIS